MQRQGVEIGVQVPANTIGTDQHDRAQGVQGGGTNGVGVGSRRRARRGATLIRALAQHARAVPCPARPADLGADRVDLILQAIEMAPPTVVDQTRIIQIARVEFGNKRRVRA